MKPRNIIKNNTNSEQILFNNKIDLNNNQKQKNQVFCSETKIEQQNWLNDKNLLNYNNNQLLMNQNNCIIHFFI